MIFGENEDMIDDLPLETGGDDVATEEGKFDLEAAIAPEGQSKAKSVLDTKKKPAQEVLEADPDNENEADQGDPIEEDDQEDFTEGKGDKKPVSTKMVATPDAAWANSLQNALQGKYGKELTLPVGGTKEEILEALEEHFTPNLHPEAVRLQQHLDKGGKVTDYMAQRSDIQRLLSIPDDKVLMKEVYQRKYGKSAQRPDVYWDDDKIISHLAKKEASGALEEEADAIRMQLKEEEQKREQENATYDRGGAADFKDPQQVERMLSNVDAATDTVIKGGKLFGLDLSKAGTASDLKALMRHMFKPNERGVTPYDRRMAGNNAFIQSALLLHMADHGLIDASLLEKANSGKRSVLRSLAPQPRTAGGGKSAKPAFDVQKAIAPEGFSRSSKT